jgi:PAS domain S-box-containing protein
MARRRPARVSADELAAPESAFLATLLDEATLGAAFLDATLCVARANAQFAAIYGAALPQLIGRPLAEALPQFAPFVGALGPLLAGGGALRDVGMPGAPGRDARASFLAARDDKGRIVGLTIIARDVTEQLRSDEALHESELRYRDLFQHAHDIVYILDIQGVVRDLNAAGERILGYRREELVGRQIAEIVAPSFLETMAQMRNRKVDTGGVTTYELEVTAKDGRQLVLEVSSRLMFRRGQPAEIHGIARDITERKQTEAALRVLYQQSQDAVRFRDQFLSIAAHELRTPLTALAGYAEVLLRYSTGDHALPPRVHRAAATINRQAQRLGGLISELLDVSRIELGQFTLNRTPLDLVWLVAQAVDAAQLISDAHPIALLAPPEPLVVLGDALRLEQVLQNLLHNAIKYSPGGGPVRVRVSAREHEAAIEVEDAGIGIPSAALPHLFQRFYRVDNVAAQQVTGMGIGLYVVGEIVARHGGRIEVASGEGQGSTFTVWLPLDHGARREA